VRKILGLLSQGPALPTLMMASYTPGGSVAGANVLAAAPVASPAKKAAPVAARREPRILYKWRSADGVDHIAQTPPAGVDYTTVRLTD
jgi:hypothetical protein